MISFYFRIALSGLFEILTSTAEAQSHRGLAEKGNKLWIFMIFSALSLRLSVTMVGFVPVQILKSV